MINTQQLRPNTGLCPVFILVFTEVYMATYKTKYFGEFEADDINDEGLIETSVKNNGEDVPVSIIINNFSDNVDRIDEIIAMLDNYFEMHEAAKTYIGKNYHENDYIVKFLFRYAGEFLRKEYEKTGGKTFSLDLENMIAHLDPPSVSFQKYQSGKLLAEMTYYCPDVENAVITITIDRDCKIYHAEYHNYR
jgi:hypothetical protein